MTSTSRLITVFGSLHYDIAVYGPARPRKGETVTGSAWGPKCGGKGGNQAVSVARAGGSVEMVGAVGDDDFGQTLLANLERKGVGRDFVRVEPGAKSGMSVAVFDAEGDYGAVIVSGSNLLLSEADIASAADLFARSSILLLQNEVPDAANVAAARAAKKAGGTTILNAAPARPLSAELIELIDILVVNAIEAEFLADVAVVETLNGALDAAQLLTAQYPGVVVTAGGAGVAFADKGGSVFAIEGEPVTVESTHGAGDEFVGALATALAAELDIATALGIANHAAAMLVSTPESDRQ
jgi:ribokinase